MSLANRESDPSSDYKSTSTHCPPADSPHSHSPSGRQGSLGSSSLLSGHRSGVPLVLVPPHPRHRRGDGGWGHSGDRATRL